MKIPSSDNIIRNIKMLSTDVLDINSLKAVQVPLYCHWLLNYVSDKSFHDHSEWKTAWFCTHKWFRNDM